MIGILLPTRGRYEALSETFFSLSNLDNCDDIELIVVVDNDLRSYEIAVDFKQRFSVFGEMNVIFSEERLYSVRAFNVGLDYLKSEIFCWIVNKLTFEKWAIRNLYSKFLEEFPDKIGVVACGGKLNKANFGMTSKEFIKYNNGEWFNLEYKINFCDDELACRAILLGRYFFLKNSGFIHNVEEGEKELLLDVDEKRQLKVKDRSLFYKRSEINFGLDENKTFPWKGFRNINEILKR